MARLEKFFDDCIQLMSELDTQDTYFTNLELDRLNNEFRFSFLRNGESTKVSVSASEDYPDIVPVCVVVGDVDVAIEWDDDQSCDDSSAETDSDALSTTLEYSHTDSKLEEDLKAVKASDGMKAVNGHPLVHYVIHETIEQCEIQYWLPVDHLQPQVIKAWDLVEDEPLVVKLTQIDTLAYRGSQRRPTVTVQKQDDFDGVKKFVVGEQLKMILGEYLRLEWNKDEEPGNIFEILFTMAHKRLETLSEHCIICDERHVFGGLLMPSVCCRPLCTFAYEKLGLMASVAFLACEIEVIDLLLAFLSAAAISTRQTLIFDPFPSVSNPDKSDALSLDPESPNYAEVLRIIDQLPCMGLMTQTNMVESLKEVDPISWPLVRWTVASNRSYLKPIPEAERLPFMKTSHQFLMLADSPQKEEIFCKAKTANPKGSIFLFHGSPMENWHSILRKGLIIASGSKLQMHGVAHGSGIYLSPSSQMSLGYSGRSCGSGDWRSMGLCPKARDENHSCTEDGRFIGNPSGKICIAICEVVDSDQLQRTSNDGIWVLKNPDHCCTRFLFIFDQGSQHNTDVNLMTETAKEALETALNSRKRHKNEDVWV